MVPEFSTMPFDFLFLICKASGVVKRNNKAMHT
jgi:hypothetical protein